MTRVAIALSIGVLITLYGIGELTGFSSPGSDQLARAWGGEAAEEKCQDCKYTAGGCMGDSCTPHSAMGIQFWYQKTGTLTTPAACFVVAETAPGAETCFDDTPKVCYTTKICQAAGCNNCGDSFEHKVDTNCGVGGEYCPPKQATGVSKGSDIR